MQNKDYELLRESVLPDAESRFAAFLRNSSYALIGGAWVVLSEFDPQQQTIHSRAIFFAIGLAITFIMVHGLGMWAGVKHYHRISDNHKQFEDDGFLQTCYGKVSSALLWIEPLLLISSAIAFILGVGAMLRF